MVEITNASLLNSTNFRFELERAPYLTFFTQNVILPSISLGYSDVENPFSTISYPGDHLNFDPLNVTFMVDEDLNGYIEIFNWMKGLGFPNTFEEYKDLVFNEVYTSRTTETTSDISVFTMTGSRNANIKYTFFDAYPISLSPIVLNSSVVDVPTLTCQATFRYTNFDIESIK